METTNVVIPLKEYKELLEISVRVKAFADFVNSTEYSIDKGDCARFLGFDVIEKED